MNRVLLLAFVLVSGPGLAACGPGSTPAGPDEPTAELTERLETARFVFLHSPGDEVHADWQERYQAWLEATLGLRAERKIEYRKYRSVAHKTRLTGTAGNALAEPAAFRIHTIWPRDDHEVVHVVVNTPVGPAPALFGEGIAVAHQVDPDREDGVARWSGTPVHELARRFVADGDLPALDDLVTSTAFRRHSAEVTYPAAGSFVRFLLNRDGLEPMWSLHRAVGPDAAEGDVRAAFASAYGRPLAEAWDAWRTFLTDR